MANKSILDLDYAKYDFKDPEKFVFKSEKGLSRQTVEQISDMKKEPEWMKKFRLRAYEHFLKRPMPTWGGNLSHIDFNDIYYYLRPTDKVEKSWDDVPEKIKKTFDRLGIPEAEKKFLAGVGAQYESEVVYHSLLKHLEDKGVIFCDTDTAVKLHPELVKKYFGTIIPPEDNKLAALNSAVWSGGSFIYIPEGVKVDLPLQAYFRINAANMGQFERTLIIADNYADVQYIEGCTAPVYSTDSLHSAVVEIIAKKGARVRYTTLQNWSSDVYNLVTKRAYAYEDASVECVKPDTLILGDNKPIIEYDVGNHAVGASGENIVTRTYANEFDGDMVRIRAVGMFPIEVTPEHPILVSRSRMTYPGVMRNGKHRHTMKIAVGSPAWTPASQLLAKHSFANGDYVLIPRLEGSVNVNELDLAPFAKNIKGLHIMEI